MSIISGLSCTQSTGDTTATVANIFQHEQNATRLEVDVFHNPAVYLRESNKYSCPHKSQPLGKNKAVWATGRRWTFSLRSHKPAGILIPRKSDIFNTLSMNFAQPKILCSIQNQEVCIRFSLIKLTWSVFLLCSKTQPWLKCSRQMPGLLGMTLSHPRHHVSTPPSKFPHLIKVLRFLHWFAASPFIGRDCFANISRERKQLNRLSLKLGPSLRWPRVNLNGNTHEVWPW